VECRFGHTNRLDEFLFQSGAHQQHRFPIQIRLLMLVILMVAVAAADAFVLLLLLLLSLRRLLRLLLLWLWLLGCHGCHTQGCRRAFAVDAVE
jgi:hypothetical protein